MRVLMISGDRNLLNPLSEAGKRLALQRAQVEELDVFVWPQVHTLREIFRAARHNHYDVITAQDPFWRGHLAHHLSQLFGGRLNIQVHTDLSAYSWLKRLFARLQLRSADSIRVVSEAIAAQVRSLGAKAPITVLPIYIDLARLRTVPRTPHEGKVILWIGRFETEKDPLLALDIFARIQEAFPAARLVMLGSGSLEARLRERAQRLPAMPDGGPRVEFPGWQDPVHYLAMSDLVLSTSKHESYGASIIEALAAGVPVVAPDVGIARGAGAIVVSREELAKAAIEALQSGAQGQLKITPLDAQAWARTWKESL